LIRGVCAGGGGRCSGRAAFGVRAGAVRGLYNVAARLANSSCTPWASFHFCWSDEAAPLPTASTNIKLANVNSPSSAGGTLVRLRSGLRGLLCWGGALATHVQHLARTAWTVLAKTVLHAGAGMFAYGVLNLVLM